MAGFNAAVVGVVGDGPMAAISGGGGGAKGFSARVGGRDCPAADNTRLMVARGGDDPGGLNNDSNEFRGDGVLLWWQVSLSWLLLSVFVGCGTPPPSSGSVDVGGVNGEDVG